MIPWNYPGFFAVGHVVVGAPEGRAVGPQQRRRRLGRHQGRQAQLFRRRVRQRQRRHQPAVLGEVAAGAPRPGAGLLGQRQLLRRQGHPLVSTWAGRCRGRRELAGRQQDLRRGQRRRAVRKEARRRQLRSPRKAAYYHFNVADGGVSDSLYVLAGLRHPDDRRRQHPAHGPLPVGEDQGRHRHESLEPGCRAVLPDQGPGAAACSPPTATRTRVDARPPTPSSSGRRQSSSKVYAPEIGNHQRFIASKTNT